MGHREAVVMGREGHLSLDVFHIQTSIRWIWYGGRRRSKETFGKDDPGDHQDRSGDFQPLLRQAAECKGEPPVGKANAPLQISAGFRRQEFQS